MRFGVRDVLVLACLTAVAAACAGDGPAVDEDQTWFDQIQSDVFDQSCLAGACHNSATRAGNLSLAAGESYDQLVGILPDNSAARDAGFFRVLPDSVAESFLVAKLTGDLSAGEGSQMPIGAPPIASDQIANIEAWIDAGAPETGPPPDETGTTTEPTDPAAPSFGEVQREIFDASCVASACHNDATRAAGLSLATGSSYDAIVGVEPTTSAARDDGLLLVAPGEPERSFLLNKITGELAVGDGSQMPLAASPLPDATIELLRDWIAAGAADDEG